MDCPRCHKSHYNTIRISRYNKKMPVNKCCICGYLWIADEDLIELTKDEAKRMFIETLMKMGKGRNDNTKRSDTS